MDAGGAVVIIAAGPKRAVAARLVSAGLVGMAGAVAVAASVMAACGWCCSG
ncbi:hypothetical protein EM6_1799 [Asticcacaulis excentricus]|uniref:Uncharacterized protein n=1 Tax=Asticcacaulis excentricus TaxID=78587 RepID=A0A3G9G7Q2_9CAUL|nr:hypothetical protein EM6_1799 [Asticcacaulis excentricus]